MWLFVSIQMLIDIKFDMTLSLPSITGITFSTSKFNHNVGSLRDLISNWNAFLWDETCQFSQVFSWYFMTRLRDKVTGSSSLVAWYLRSLYLSKIYEVINNGSNFKNEVINNASNFKRLSSDPTIQREASIRCILGILRRRFCLQQKGVVRFL